VRGGEGDGELARRAAAGEEAAFLRLCERHQERIWRIAASVARGVDAEDLAQEAIVRAYRALGSYRAEAPFEAWLCRIALNVAHDYNRSAWRRRVTLCETPPAGGEDDSPEGEVERRELQRRVRQAVAALPPGQRTPLWLHYFEGFTLAAVARLEGAPEATNRSRVRAGLRRLSRSLGDLLPLPEGQPVTLEPDPKGCGA
jgi:RNA polymerase sigma-70 factor (ECF subfamily)